MLMRQEIILEGTKIVLSLPHTDEAVEWIENEFEMLKFRSENRFPKQTQELCTK